MKMDDFTTASLLQSTAASPELTEREKHLIGLAVTATRGCIQCTGSRLKKAGEQGIPREVLRAAIDLAAAVNAGVTVAIAVQGAERFAVGDGCCDADGKCV